MNANLQALQVELSSLCESSQQQERRLREMEEEVKTHTTTSRMVTNDLESWYMKEQTYNLPLAKIGRAWPMRF